jgi:hypothetical protein
MNKWLKGLSVISFAAIAQLSTTSVFAEGSENQAYKPDWYVHMNAKALQASSLGNKFSNEKDTGMALMNALLGKELVEQINYITLQGKMNDDNNKVLLINGDFAEAPHFLSNKWKEFGFTKTTKFEKNTIYSGNLKKLLLSIKANKDKFKGITIEESEQAIEGIETSGDLDKILYSAFKDASTVVISDNIENVKYWLNNKQKWEPANHSNVFEVVVDIEKSLLHGGVNLDEASENYQFESISAKQLSQVSATYSESNGYADLQIGLETANSETADKIKSIVYGLIALKTLSTNDQTVTSLLSGFQLEQDAGNLVAKLSGPIESFQALFENM